MPTKLQSAIQGYLNNSSNYLEVDQSAPFGFWLLNPRDQEVFLSNSFKQVLKLNASGERHFLANTLGKHQLQLVLETKGNEVETANFIYPSENGLIVLSGQIERLQSEDDIILVRNIEEGINPFSPSPLAFAYLAKIDELGNYGYVNTAYRSAFCTEDLPFSQPFGCGKIDENSKEAYYSSIELAFAKPGTVLSAQLDIRGLKDLIQSTAWEFVCLLEAGSHPVVYARGYDVTALRSAEKMISLDQRELDVFINNQLNAVFFMMLPEPLNLKHFSSQAEAMDYAIENMRITKANRNFAELFEMSQESDYLGLRIDDFMIDDPEGRWQMVQALFNDGRLHAFTSVHKRNGSPMVLEGDYKLLHDGAEQILGIIGIQQDVTESKRQREQVRSSILQLQKLTENIPGIVFQVDVSPEDEIELKFLSESYQSKQFGVDREQLMEHPMLVIDQVSPKDYSTVLGSIIYASRNNTELDVEFRVQNKMGEEFWYRAKAKSEDKPDKGGKTWFGILDSVDAQKNYEKQQFKLAQIARSTSDLILVLNENGTLDWVNKAGTEFFNWNLREVIERPIQQLLQAEEKSEELPLLFQAIERHRNYEVKMQLRTNDDLCWLQIRNKPIWNSNGEFLFSLIVMKDIDQEEMKNIQMQSLLNLSSDQNNRLQNFTYIISHNIRSHSASFQGLIDTIEVSKDPKEKEELWSYLKEVSKGLELTIRHLNEIIVFNQSLNRNKQNLNLKTEINRVLKIVAREFEANKAVLTFDFEPDQQVMAVKAYLESIILNLITNALRYRHPERNPHISVSCELGDEKVFIHFRDNGLGIDLEKYGSKLFQLYQTFHNHPQSRGLGLYMLKSQVEAMGGEIGVESTLGEGTCFYFSLPISSEE